MNGIFPCHFQIRRGGRQKDRLRAVIPLLFDNNDFLIFYKPDTLSKSEDNITIVSYSAI